MNVTYTRKAFTEILPGLPLFILKATTVYMVHKGISPVIASILLILIVIALASSYVVFTNRLAQEQTETAEEQAQKVRTGAATLFHIETVSGRNVVVVNDGLQDLSPADLTVIVDSTQLNFTHSGTPIKPRESGTLTVQGLWRIGPGEHRLQMRGASKTDSVTVRVDPVKEGRVLDMRFDEGSGDTANDLSGNRNVGTLKNGPVWTQGRFGNALDFDGVDDYVALPTQTVLDGSTTATVEAWVNPNAGFTSNYRAIYYESTSGGSNNFLLQTNVIGGEVRFFISPTLCQTLQALQSNKWSHIVGSYDGSEMRIYIDGNLMQSCAKTGAISDANIPKNIGRYEGGSQYFSGAIDGVRIYNRAYVPDELYVLRRA